MNDTQNQNGRAQAAKLIGSLMVLLIISTSADARTVTLTWSAHNDPNFSSYTVYYGTSSGNYQSSVNVGNSPSHTVSGLGSSAYFFAVTASSVSGDESGFSTEAFLPGGNSPGGCDLNGDSSTDALDIQTSANAILAGNSSVGDLNGDGSVSVLDLQLLANAVLGVFTCP